MNLVRKLTYFKSTSFLSLHLSIGGSQKILTKFPHITKFSQPRLYHKAIYYFSNQGQGQNKKQLSRQQKFKQKEQQLLNKTPQLEQDQQSYSKSQNKMGKYVMGVSVAALLIFYAMMEIQGLRVQKKIDKSITGLTKVTASGKAQIGGQWALTDTKGRKFGSKDLEGTYYLIYFGFTNCPDICPNYLLKLCKAVQKIRKMPQYQYINLKTIFVSVDPDRDTPQKIQKFLAYFDNTIIGVTGKHNNDEQLKECMRKFKIYATKVQFEDEDVTLKGRKSYTMDHTTLGYLVSDSNQYITHIGGSMGEHELAKMVITKIIGHEQQKMQLLKAT